MSGVISVGYTAADGTAATEKFTAAGGSVDAWVVQAGATLPIDVRRVWATGTTSNIGVHALY